MKRNLVTIFTALILIGWIDGNTYKAFVNAEELSSDSSSQVDNSSTKEQTSKEAVEPEETEHLSTAERVIAEKDNNTLGSQSIETKNGFHPFLLGKRSNLTTNTLASRSLDLALSRIGASDNTRPAKDFIDISSHNGNISVANYNTMKTFGVKGVFIKLTEYTTYQNPYAAQQIVNAKAAGLKIGVYHYSWFNSVSGAKAEANYFATMAKSLGLPADTVMVNDAEQADMTAGNVTTNSVAFADQLKSLGYNRVMHYSMLNWFSTGIMNASTLGYKNIWVAQYPYEPLASNLLNKEYGAWQWSSELTFPGIDGNFDISIDYNNIFDDRVVYDRIYYNNEANFTVKLKNVGLTANHAIYDDIYYTKPGIFEIGKGSLYANQTATILRVAKTDKATWFEFAISGNVIGWINSKAFDLTAGKAYYSAYVNENGWQYEAFDGQSAGTTGSRKRIESLQMNVNNTNLGYAGDIEYRAHIQSIGWQSNYSKNGIFVGMANSGKRIEAIQVRLTGELAKKYDVYYRTHVSSLGWLGWAKNDELAGSSKYGYSMEDFQVVVVPKGQDAPGPIENSYREKGTDILYQSYMQPGTWQANTSSLQNTFSGTVGEGKQVEAVKLSLREQEYTGDITYQLHVQSKGWLDIVKNNAISGTIGEGKQAEAVRMNLTGEMAANYDVYYRVHSRQFGWLDWAKNGEAAGTAGYSYRMEAFQVKLVAKGQAPPGPTENSYKEKPIDILYQSYIEQGMWQDGISSLQETFSGTVGEGKQIEAVKIGLRDQKYIGDIMYQLHVQSKGWLDEVKNNTINGTVGEGKRAEAVRMNLTGEVAANHDIYYRVHSRQFGWLDWAKNGEAAGTTGYAYRMEALQIKLIAKGQSAPGATSSPFKSK